MPLFFKKKQKTKCGEGCKNAEFTLLFVNYTPIKLKVKNRYFHAREYYAAITMFQTIFDGIGE